MVSREFYLLSMADYLCHKNGLPVCEDYDDIRKHKLAEPIFPGDIMVAVKLDPALDERKPGWDNAMIIMADKICQVICWKKIKY